MAPNWPNRPGPTPEQKARVEAEALLREQGPPNRKARREIVRRLRRALRNAAAKPNPAPFAWLEEWKRGDEIRERLQPARRAA